MSFLHLDSNASEIEALFAAERELVPELDDLRNRVLQRVRELLPRDLSVRTAVRSPTPRQLRIGVIAAAAILLPALCSAAFFAGYHARNDRAEVPVKTPTLTAFVVLPQAPASSVVLAPAPIEPSVHSLFANSDAALQTPRPARSKPASSARSTEIEAYGMELRVLQPARLAVARQDYASALSVIAEHHHQFPSGRLAEEREALRVKALLGLGRTAEARRAGVAFRARFPRSALLGRIDEMLGPQQ
jgi:hypothetical protein